MNERASEADGSGGNISTLQFSSTISSLDHLESILIYLHIPALASSTPFLHSNQIDIFKHGKYYFIPLCKALPCS